MALPASMLRKDWSGIIHIRLITEPILTPQPDVLF